MKYAKASLGEVLEMDLDQVEVEPLATYPMAGVYSFGKGLFAREPIAGADTSYKKLTRLHEGQFVVSRLKAFEGAVAVVPADFDGWFLSQEFPTFRVKPTGHPGYLAHICRWPSFWGILTASSKGIGARRERVHPEQLLSIEIPLPDLDEQRRITDKLDVFFNLTSQVRNASNLVDHGRLSSMIPSVIDRELSRATESRKPLGDVAEFVSDVFKPGEPIEPAEAFVGLQHIEPHTGRAISFEPLGAERGPKHRFAPGDITYPRLRPYQNKVWLADRHGLCSVDQYVLRPTPEVSGLALALSMRSRSFLEAAVDATSRLQHPRIRKKDLSSIEVLIVDPSRAPAVERQISALLLAIGRAARLRSQNATRLNALEVSALNQAFLGQT